MESSEIRSTETAAGGQKKLEQIEMDIKCAGDEEATNTANGVVGTNYNKEDEALDLDGMISKPRRSTRKLCARRLATMFINVGGEFVGTFLLTLVICTAVAASVVARAHVGLWQVAVMCGLGVSLSIYCTAHVSDAHLNPAITLAFAIVRFKAFSWKKVLPYMISQMLGGITAGGVLFGLYGGAITQFEEQFDIIRGGNNSQLTAMLFGEYFPNPALYDHSIEENLDVISPIGAMVVEAWTTGILAFVIFALTCQQNSTVGTGNNKVVVPMVIGITVAILIGIYAPLTQVGMNPARDFGPRIFAACAGWGRVAIPGPRNGFWTYIIGPHIGALLGAALYDCAFSVAVKLAKSNRQDNENNHAKSNTR